MIREVTMYVAECDRCGYRDDKGDYCAWTDAASAEESATDDEWAKLNGRHLCFDCWTWSEDGDAIIEKPAAHPVQEQQT